MACWHRAIDQGRITPCYLFSVQRNLGKDRDRLLRIRGVTHITEPHHRLRDSTHRSGEGWRCERCFQVQGRLRGFKSKGCLLRSRNRLVRIRGIINIAQADIDFRQCHHSATPGDGLHGGIGGGPFRGVVKIARTLSHRITAAWRWINSNINGPTPAVNLSSSGGHVNLADFPSFRKITKLYEFHHIVDIRWQLDCWHRAIDQGRIIP